MSKAAATEEDRRLTAVEVAGFKSAREPVRVNFRDITILAGANSSGKSTVMQPLLLIKQTIEKPFDPGGLAIDGPLVRFTHADQFFSHTKVKAEKQTFSVAVEQSDRRIWLLYGRGDASGMRAMEMKFREDGKENSWRYNQYLDIKDESLTPSMVNTVKSLMEIDNLTFEKLKIKLDRDRFSLEAIVQIDEVEEKKFYFPIFSPAHAMGHEIKNMIYLPGLRGNPERYYAISASGPLYSGNFNDYSASVIHHWETEKDDRIKTLANNLKFLGLTSHVTIKSVDDTRIEVRVGRLPAAARSGARDTVNIADVGFGVSQTLPVLVALLAAAPGQMVFVEQPELHLHPRAQVKMAEIILQAADRGARVVIETHSSLLILALQALIAEGKLAPERLSLNWFTRDKTGQTHVAEAKLTSDGGYGDWPVDFDEVDLALQNRYLTQVDRLRAES